MLQTHHLCRPHWLLQSIYGRDVLKAKLRKLRPDLKVKYWARQPELDPALESMIDLLGLRGWRQPRALPERFRYFTQVMRIHISVELG